MAVNGVSTVEDADMAECDDEKVVTMMDVLQEQKDFEDDANAVLGASDDKNCTYSKGYIKRQAIYACLTCCLEAKDDPSKRAGVCLACSLNCHENHELIELYTKRNFRCDCGNPKFNSHPCQFTPDKSDLNHDNKYNQNFSGLYCNCHRPYPDPENTVEDDEMIQCIICEDWLHATHLDAVVPGIDQYSEMICKACMENNEFLHDYSNLAVNIETGDVDVIAVNGTNTNLSNGNLEEKLVNGTGDSSEDTTKEPKNDMDVDGAQTDNHELEKPVEENKANENDVPKETEKTDDTSQISSDVNDHSKDETNTAITSEESTKSFKDTLNVLSYDAKESSKPQESQEAPLENADNTEAIQEPEETKGKEDNVEQDMPESENFDNNPENSEAMDEATEITSETSNGHDELQKLDSKDSDENNTIQTATENSDSLDFKEPEENNVNETSSGNNDSLDSKEPEEDKVMQTTTKEDDSLDSKKPEENNVAQTTTENDESRLDIKINDIASNDAKAAETENSDVAKEENSTYENENTETDKLSNEIAPEAEINDSISKVESNEIPIDVNSDEPAVSKIEVSNETVNDTEEVTETTDEIKENKRKFSTEEAIDDNFVKKRKLDEESQCTRPKNFKRVHKGATFWPSNFRQKLCTCNECLSMYKDLSVLFLLDSEDTVMAYEILGKEMVDGRATQYEKGLEALSSLDRIQQINALTEYNKMKDKLLDFLKSFKDRKEIVKEEDIKAFFAGMKPKREPDGVYFCR